jgi:uncharacterized SAM-binding protein YcdF (DUF218 family)/glycosyltransferase involved in cell wall biosynthesis
MTATASAPLGDRPIVCFSSIDWDFLWQGHQEIMSTFAAQGNVVLFVDNTGVRSPRLRDARRVAHRLRTWWRGTNGFRQERPNLFVYSPLLLPFPHSRIARWFNRAVLRRALGRWLQATGFSRPIIWTFLPTRLVVDLVDLLNPSLVVYYCVADFGELAPMRSIATSERMLLDRCDVVFIQGEELRPRCVPHTNVHVFPSGVNVERLRQDPTIAPELHAVKRPIVGYVGGFHRHLDVALLEAIADAWEGSIVFVGPEQEDAGRLHKAENTIFVGPQPHARIGQFLSAFDVGIIPYALTAYTRTVYPTKLNEYLAAGLPVVSTPLPEVVRFNAQHGDVVAIARDAEAFLDAISRGIRDDSAPARTRRVEVARASSWGPRIERMKALMADAMVRRRPPPEEWQASLYRLYSAARRRVLTATAMVAGAYLLLFHSPLIWVAAEPLRVVDEPRPADAIVVFAGGVGESGKAGGGYLERVKRAVELYQLGYAPRMIFVSGYFGAFREVEVMSSLAVSLEVPREAIILESTPVNTHENVRVLRPILAERRWHRILLVSSPYHMRRALGTFRKGAPEIAVRSTPVTASEFYARHGRGLRAEQILGIVHEYAALAAYWWRGYL